jgi:hypothetical protein
MNNKTIYHLLGKISVTFASLEHGLVYLLEYLLTKKECALVALYVLHGIPISRLIEKTKSIAEVRLWEHKKTLKKLKIVLKDIDELRVQRNWFIHGNWYIKEPADNADSATVVNFKPKLDKKSGRWQCLNDKNLTKRELNQLLQKATIALKNFRKIDAEIRKLELRGNI